MSSRRRLALLSLRTTVVLLIGFLIGLAAGGLDYLSSRDAAGALLTGGGFGGASVLGLHQLIGP